MIRFALRHADAVLAVDPSLKDRATHLAGYDGGNIIYLPTGYDCEFWRPAGVKIPVVLYVATVDDEVRARVKGLDLILEAARRLPESRFILVGISSGMSKSANFPPNVVVHTAMPRPELLPFYQHAKVYCQPSRHEGLSNALCEAMLCGCIPVATDVGGNRTAVGDAGFLVDVEDENGLVESLRAGLQKGEAEAVKARARIVSLFPMEKRHRDLLRLVEEKSR
jgi:glycosyltransferase involved in cell wall biosynthesis